MSLLIYLLALTSLKLLLPLDTLSLPDRRFVTSQGWDLGTVLVGNVEERVFDSTGQLIQWLTTTAKTAV